MKNSATQLVLLTIRLFVGGGLFFAAEAPAIERESTQRESDSGFFPPQTHTDQLPDGMIRLGPTLVIAPTNVTSNPGPGPVIFSQWLTAISPPNPARFEPPDPHGACGPKGYLSTNLMYFSYADRSGSAKWANTSGAMFPGSSSAQAADARATYDPNAGRFYVAMLSYTNTNHSYCYLAVSKNSDPSSTDWYTYQVEMTEVSGGNSYGGDYTTIGFDSQAVYLAFRMVSLPFGTFGIVKNDQIIVFDKSKVMAGDSSPPTRVFTPDGVGDDLQPVSIYGSNGAGDVAYFAEAVSATSVRLWALNHPLTQTPALTYTTITVPNNGGAVGTAPQLGGSGLATLASYAQGNAFWASGAAWFCLTAGASAGRSIVYYYKIASNSFPSGTPTLAESGFIDGGPDIWNYQPAIGGNARGDVCIGFTQSSASMYPTMMVAARQATADAFPTPILVHSSPTAYNGSRWGDNATVSADPIDTTFWVGSEVVNSGLQNDWSSWLANVTFPGPSAWISNGLPIRQSVTGASLPVVVSDGAGGTIVAWVDSRDAVPHNYVQRLTGTGAVSSGWSTTGLPLFAGVATATRLCACDDAAHGAYIAWSSAAGIVVQRVAGSGAIASGWPAPGVQLSNANSFLSIIADGSGGAIVAWASSGVKLQRIDGSGNLLWGTGGVSVSTSGGGPTVASDGSGGAIVAWNPNVRVQRVNSSGAAQWTSGGTSLATGSNARIAADGVGGAVVAYQKVGNGQDIYAVRITSSGSPASGWTAGGIAVCSAANDQVDPRLVSDGSGGAALSWTDFRSDTHGDVYAGRVSGSGAIAPGWPSNGAAVCTASLDQSATVIAGDGLGGAVISWQDGRADGDIYCHHVSNEGFLDPSLPANGLGICTASGVQSAPTLVIAQSGQAIVAWQDGRLYADCNPYCATGIYASSLSFDAVAPSAITSLATTRGPHTMILSWTEPGDDGTSGPANHFDVRYSSSTITAANFFSANGVIPPAPNGVPGSTDCVTIAGLVPCHTYYFAVKTYDDAANASPISVVISAATKCNGNDLDCGSGPATAVGQPPVGPTGAPAELELGAPTPNPSSASCTIEFGIPAKLAGGVATLEILDIAGRRIRTLKSGDMVAGWHQGRWDMRTSSGGLVSPGLFFARVSVGGQALVRRVVVVHP